MINTAAMVGLGNDPAYKQLQGINKSIQELFKLKQSDSKDEAKFHAKEREQDRRRKQDADLVISSQDANVQQFKSLLKDPDSGMMASLVSAAAIAGALLVMNKIDVKKFVGGVWDGVKNALPSLKPGTTEESPDVDSPPSAATNADGSPDMSEETDKEGDSENLSQADPNFKGLPMPSGAAMTSPIGMRWGRPHNGLDVAAAEGTPLTVAKPGKIVQIASEGPTKGYGNYIVFKDTLGEHIYAHLQKYGKYKVGQAVKPGDVIAYMGNTGRSFGAHLHWEFDPQSGKVGYPRPLSKTTDPTKSGYKWSSPLTGLQSGGMVGLPGRPGPISIKNPISLPAQHQSGGHVQYLMQEGGPLSIINQITNVSRPTTMVKGAQPMSESSRNVKSPRKTPQMPSLGGIFSMFKMPSMTKGIGRLKLQKGGEARMDKGASKPKYLAPGEKVFKQGGKRHMISDRLPVEPKQVDPVLRPKFTAQKQGKGKSEKLRAGGIVKLQRGGSPKVNINQFMSPTMTQNNRLSENYNAGFFVRQGRKSQGVQTIIVNNMSGGNGSPPSPNMDAFAPTMRDNMNLDQPSYQDFSTNFHRYARGIRV